MRENRTCSLGGGRWLARERATSDPTPMKSPNKAGQPAAEGVEGRGLAKGNLPRQNAPRTQCRQGAHSALGRVRHAVRTTHRVFLHRADVTTLGKSRMREFRPSGSVEGVVSNHDPYSDSLRMTVRAWLVRLFAGHDTSRVLRNARWKDRKSVV